MAFLSYGISFYFPCFIEKQNQLGEIQPLARGRPWRADPGLSWCSCCPALVPGDQRHTPDVSVLRVVAGPCVCLVYLSVWSQLLSFIQKAQLFRGADTLARFSLLGAYLQFCKEETNINTDRPVWRWLSLCMYACWNGWSHRVERQALHSLGQGVEKMQVSCVCPAQLVKLIIILDLRV